MAWKRKPLPKGDPSAPHAGVSKEQGAHNELVRSKLAELLERRGSSRQPGKRESRRPESRKPKSGKSRGTRLEHILRAAIRRAEEGETAARRDVLEWFAGKPVQPIETSGPGGGPLHVVWDMPGPERERGASPGGESPEVNR